MKKKNLKPTWTKKYVKKILVDRKNCSKLSKSIEWNLIERIKNLLTKKKKFKNLSKYLNNYVKKNYP